MSHKLLWLVLAGGEGSRVKHLLKGDEPTKPMINISGKRLIEIALEEAGKVDCETAILTYPSELYESLDRLIEQRGVKVLKQEAQHRKLPHLLQLPHIMRSQYRSPDGEYLASFDSILTYACDIVYDGVDFRAMVDFHNSNLASSDERQLTILSKRGAHGRAYNFKIENGRLASVKWFSSQQAEGYAPYVSPGVYMFSRAVLKNPWGLLLGLNYNKVLIFETEGSWKDVGNPQVLKTMRQ